MIQFPNLDIDVTSACNLACLNCNRMVTPYRAAGVPPSTTPAIVARDLAAFKMFGRTTRIGIVGGEPTLHPQLVAILNAVREAEVTSDIALWTNGTLLWKFLDRPGFWQAFDTLVLSIYPGKLSDEAAAQIYEACRKYGKKLDVHDERQTPNWTRILEPTPTNDSDTQDKYTQCWFKTYCFALNYGHLFRCCTSPHIPHLLQGRPYGADGLCLKNASEGDVRTFLDRKTLMESCRICAGRSVYGDPLVKWGEERNINEWLRKSREAK